jgi:hypothetical protein
LIALVIVVELFPLAAFAVDKEKDFGIRATSLKKLNFSPE